MFWFGGRDTAAGTVVRGPLQPGGAAMAYVEGRGVYDADSHVMELPDCLEEFADPGIRERLRPLRLGGAGALADAAVKRAVQRREDGPDALPSDPHELLRAKGWDAVGAFDELGAQSRSPQASAVQPQPVAG